jgi:hypothetical protein
MRKRLRLALHLPAPVNPYHHYNLETITRMEQDKQLIRRYYHHYPLKHPSVFQIEEVVEVVEEPACGDRDLVHVRVRVQVLGQKGKKEEEKQGNHNH